MAALQGNKGCVRPDCCSDGCHLPSLALGRSLYKPACSILQDALGSTVPFEDSRQVPAVPCPAPCPTCSSPPSTHLMHLIHSSFSSGVGAEMRYTVWLPSTTRPSASVLQALITWSLLSGM